MDIEMSTDINLRQVLCVKLYGGHVYRAKDSFCYWCGLTVTQAYRSTAPFVNIYLTGESCMMRAHEGGPLRENILVTEAKFPHWYKVQESD